jgi:hypothetical protein
MTETSQMAAHKLQERIEELQIQLAELHIRYDAQREADSEVKVELEAAMSEASRLALAIWQDFYRCASPEFELCDSLRGVLSQISNMYAGLREQLAAKDAHVHGLLTVLAERNADARFMVAESEIVAVKAELSVYRDAVAHVTDSTRGSFSSSAGWAMISNTYLSDLEALRPAEPAPVEQQEQK